MSHEELTDGHKGFLRSLCSAILERDSWGLFPSTKYVEPDDRHISAFPKPTKALPDQIETFDVMKLLASIGLIRATPIQGSKDGMFHVEITETGAEAIDKKLVYPVSDDY